MNSRLRKTSEKSQSSSKRKSTKNPKSDLSSAHGPKARFSFKRNMLPPLLGIVATLVVLGLLNGQYLVAQYRYHFADKSALNSTTTTAISNGSGNNGSSANTVSPNPERGPYLTIPSIGVEAPVIFEPSIAEWKVQLALREGVGHYGTTANPGQNGNMVILGHSSGQPWGPGKFKFVFTLLDKVQKDQAIVVDYQGVRYIYKVTETFVVAPTNTAVLAATSKPTLTLITCTPVGTSTNRLIVKAELVSPLPVAGSNAGATTQSSPTPQQLPSN